MQKKTDRKLFLSRDTLRKLDLMRVGGGARIQFTDTCNTPCTSGNSNCCTTGPCNRCNV